MTDPRERLLTARIRLVELGAVVDGFVPDNELHIEVLAAEEERRAELLLALRPSGPCTR